MLMKDTKKFICIIYLLISDYEPKFIIFYHVLFHKTRIILISLLLRMHYVEE